ncbi:helix-turn-helix domain-containing protein [Paraburkholderia silvatlantica]|uniref:helix-turn-helix domain-containing protein n=1 Tax=Paraburkholderia silvatlantica TaxID=321895 RepID=UPI00105E9405|nr:helix-turn-helix domain-containing protein [Paraburkholderia silvatlantica]TDQ93239.1 hypothetical protein C7412_109222 [Paraburkholderia silvatlantica]
MPLGNSSRHPTEKRRAIRTPHESRIAEGGLLPPHSQPMSPGLMVVLIRGKHLGRDVRAAFETQYVNGGSVAGIPAPEAEFMWSLHSGAASVVDEQAALAEHEQLSDSAIERTFCAYGSRRNFTYCGDEGLETLLPIIEEAEGGWVTLAQSSDSISPEHLIAGMHEIRTAAEQANAYVLLFVVRGDNDQVAKIQDFCDDYLEVEECEPDPDAHLAFSIEALRFGDMHRLGYGKVLCDVTLNDDLYMRTFEPFIAKSLRDRFIWKLRASGKSLAEIGELIGLHKSSVKRCLDGMRPVRRQLLSDEEIAQYCDALEVDGDSIDEPTELPDDDTEDFA